MTDTLEWAEFEEYLYPSLRKKYPAKNNWKIESQKMLKDGRRIDWVIYNGSERIVIEAKDRQKLEIKDVQQVSDYRLGYKAREGILYVANDTIIPDYIREFAKLNKIKIVRTKWRK